MRKLFTGSFLIVLCLLACLVPPAYSQTAAAKPLRFDIKVNRKRVDVERTNTTDKILTEEKWIYNVEVRNATFAPQSDLTVEYRCYKRDDKYGADTSVSKLPLKAVPGSEKIASLANAGIYKFDTKEVKIEKNELKAGWEYTDNAKDKIKDSLYGIWIKILKNGEVVSEFVNPPALKTKAKW